jgi:hypothetical protein
MIVFLDSNILGLIENGSRSQEAIECTNWFYTLYGRGGLIFTSYFCLYEVRRSLLKEKLKVDTPPLYGKEDDRIVPKLSP